ncbi:hypothetical protein Vi05172_g7032 [Venturia inaequalis]|nr:hypothetical protein Vi05172_g7032 [Venturia inaequalis]
MSGGTFLSESHMVPAILAIILPAPRGIGSGATEGPYCVEEGGPSRAPGQQQRKAPPSAKSVSQLSQHSPKVTDGQRWLGRGTGGVGLWEGELSERMRSWSRHRQAIDGKSRTMASTLRWHAAYLPDFRW